MLRRSVLIALLAAMAIFILLAAAAAAALVTGTFDVAATRRRPAVVERLLESARDRAVEARSDSIEVPPLDDPALVRLGVAHYHEMCVTCHGAPGIEPSEIGRGLAPAPPGLSSLQPFDAAEIYWVVKNGIWSTGMPAFGPTHGDHELWAIAAFVERLPRLSPAEYAALVRDAGLGPDSEEGEEQEDAGLAVDHEHQAGPSHSHHHEASSAHDRHPPIG